MGILRSVIWTALCIGLGIFLGTHEFGGKTAVAHAEKAIEGKKLADVEDAIVSAKLKLTAPKDAPPAEKHSDADKEAVNRLIARRKP